MKDLSSYKISPADGDFHRFSVTAAPLPGDGITKVLHFLLFTFPLAFLGSCSTILVLSPALPSSTSEAAVSSMLSVLWLLFAIGLGYYSINVWQRKRREERSAGGEFLVGPSGIRLQNGTEISSARIHRLVVRNAIEKGEAGTKSIAIGTAGGVGGGSAASAVGAASAAAGVGLMMGAAMAGQALRGKQASLSYRLEVEHGGVATILAGGMSATTSHGLMEDVARALEKRA